MGAIERFTKTGFSGKMLRVVCITGLILSTIISVPLLAVSLIHARENPRQKQKSVKTQDSFAKNLEEYDQVLSRNRNTPPVNRLDSILNTAEKSAVSIDSYLSLLKRRRALAKNLPEYRPQYQNAAVRALTRFPYSESLSIIAGEALLLRKAQLDDNDKRDLSAYIKNISPGKPVILLGFRLFEGSARQLSTAKQIPQAAGIFISAADYADNIERPNLIASGAILQIMAGNQAGAVNLINRYKTVLLEQPSSAWFLVETLYDFDNPKTVASILGIHDYPYVNSQSIIRLSDTLYRMDNPQDARFFWNLLTFPEEESTPDTILEKALYNLAATSQNDDQKRTYLEELLKISPDNVNGLIMYSRLLNHQDAVPFLNSILAEKKEPLVELELIKQNRSFSEPGKTAADTWFLLGHYPGDPDMYQWASYYFEEMQMFNEAEQLKKTAGYNNIDGPWLTQQKALDAMRMGNLDQAEDLLKSIPPGTGWEIPANLGVIKESRRSINEAMEYYETAASLCRDKKDLALIQLRIARCLKALGNPGEATRVLEYAQDLDPDNLQVRLEIRKSRLQ